MTTTTDDGMPFVPLIPARTGGGKDARRLFRAAVEAALQIPECAAAIAPFKADGLVYGHRIIDDVRAVEVLLEKAPEHLQGALRTDAVKLYDKTKGMNAVLRNEWAMSKQGKVNGTPSPRLLLKQKKAAEKAAAEHPQT
jgi:hypothetical protein